MAKGLFSDFTSPDAARAAVQRDLLEEQNTTFREGLARQKGGKEMAGFTAGSFLGNLLGGFAESALGIDRVEGSPEVRAAKKDSALAKKLGAVEGDLTSSDAALAQAKIAREAGRDDLALALTVEAGNRKKTEVAAAAKTQAAVTKEARDQFNALPTAAQEELIGKQPQFLVDTIGLTPEKAAEVSNALAERNQFQKARLQKQLSDVQRATASPTTGADVAQVKNNMTTLFGIDSDSFSQFGGDEEEFEAFSGIVAGEVQRRVDIARDKGQRANEATVLKNIMKELQDGGAVSLTEKAFTIGDQKKLDILDPETLGNILGGSEAPADTKQPSGNPQQTGRRRITL